LLWDGIELRIIIERSTMRAVGVVFYLACARNRGQILKTDFRFPNYSK